MSARVLDRLGKLHPADRSWVLNQLSARERSSLMDLAVAVVPEPSSQVTTVAPAPIVGAQLPVDTVRAADAHRVSQLLQHEPAWFIALLMSLESWPWSTSVLQALPAKLRADVADLMRRAPQCGTRLRERVLEYCIAHLKHIRPTKRPTAIQSLARRVKTILIKNRLTLRS